MRIQAKDLKLQLQKNLSPIYLIYGDEPYHHSESIKQIRESAKHQGFSERIRFDITPQFDWDQFNLAIQSRSLFASKKLIECYIPEGKIGKKGAETLAHFIKMPTRDITLLIICDKLEKAVLQSTWFTTLEQQGTVIQARVLYKEEALSWLSQLMKTHGLPVEKEILNILYERSEGNLLAAAQSIEKLQLYYGTNSKPDILINIEPEDVVNMLAESARFTTFDLIDAILEGSLVRVNRVLASLKNEGIEPLFVLWSISREVRIISQFCSQIISGTSLIQVLDSANLWKRKRELFLQYFKRVTFPISEVQNKLHQSLFQAKHIDDIIKGRVSGNTWEALTFLCCMVMFVPGVQYA